MIILIIYLEYNLYFIIQFSLFIKNNYFIYLNYLINNKLLIYLIKY